MSDLLSGVLRFFLKAVLLLCGLVFVASLVFVALVLLLVGALRQLWARVTGRPVQPWAFRVDPRAQWERFYRASGRPPGDGDGAPADKTPQRKLGDVTDVEPK